MLVISAVTVAAWWFADRQTRVAVESRLSTIGQSLAAPNYPLTPPVLRAVADLTDTKLVLLNSSFEIVDTTLNLPATDQQTVRIPALSREDREDARRSY